MSRQKEFFREIRSFVVFFLIFGLWPTWKNSKYRILLIIYSIFSIFLVFCIFISAVYINNVLNDNQQLSTAVSYSFLLSNLATHFIIVVQSLFYRNELARLVNKMGFVDCLFSKKLQIHISYAKEKRAIWIRVLTILGILFFIKSFLSLHLHLRDEFGSFWFHCLYSIFIMRIRCFQVLFFVFILNARLNLLNQKLKEILVVRGLNRENSMRCSSVSDMKNVIFVLDAVTPKQTIYDRLLKVKQIYSELYEICELINMTFGWSLLAIVTQCFIDFTSNR